MPVIRKGRYAPPVHMIKVTATREITPNSTPSRATDFFFGDQQFPLPPTVLGSGQSLSARISGCRRT